MFKLDKLYLSFYDSNNIDHRLAKKELLSGKSYSKYIKQIDDRLVDKKHECFSLDSAYLVYLQGKVIGYVFLSNINKYKIYVEYSIIDNYRKKGIGKLLLIEITEYILNNYNVKEIALDIDMSNLASINLAESCGYYMEEEFDKNTANNSKDFTYINPYFNVKKK